jgi:hypothetical protein
MNDDTERAITEIEAAQRLGLSVKTLRAWRCRGRGPKFMRFGRAVRYMPFSRLRFTISESLRSSFRLRSSPRYGAVLLPQLERQLNCDDHVLRLAVLCNRRKAPLARCHNRLLIQTEF